MFVLKTGGCTDILGSVYAGVKKDESTPAAISDDFVRVDRKEPPTQSNQGKQRPSSAAHSSEQTRRGVP
jgi:hypothetical protein